MTTASSTSTNVSSIVDLNDKKAFEDYRLNGYSGHFAHGRLYAPMPLMTTRQKPTTLFRTDNDANSLVVDHRFFYFVYLFRNDCANQISPILSDIYIVKSIYWHFHFFLFLRRLDKRLVTEQCTKNVSRCLIFYH